MGGGSLTTVLHTFGVSTDTQAKQLFSGRQRLQSIKVANNGTVAQVVTFYDGTSASGKAILRTFVSVANQNLEYDMHGALVDSGLFVQVTGGGTKVHLSVSAQYS